MPSNGMLVPDWMWPHSGVVVTVEERPDAAFPVDDLRLRAKDVQITLDAVNDIRFCEKLFDQWMTELDKCVARSESLLSASCPIRRQYRVYSVASDSKKPDERERRILNA